MFISLVVLTLLAAPKPASLDSSNSTGYIIDQASVELDKTAPDPKLHHRRVYVRIRYADDTPRTFSVLPSEVHVNVEPDSTYTRVRIPDHDISDGWVQCKNQEFGCRVTRIVVFVRSDQVRRKWMQALGRPEPPQDVVPSVP